MTFLSRFIWTDLSTYELEEAKRFYHSTFQWKFLQSNEEEEAPYFMAYLKNQYVAGMYTLPSEFQAKNFPCFWMPYIHVKDVSDTVKQAQAFDGVNVEFPPTKMSDGSTLALIRDPLGAGFTAYQGPDQRPLRSGHGIPIWFELHVSQIEIVLPFYAQLFNWTIEFNQGKQKALISLANGTPVANIYVLPESLRGGYHYWIPTFQIDNEEKYVAEVQKANGQVLDGSGNGQKLVNDSQGASFLISTGINP